MVKSGQNLSVISKALYGSAAFWPALYCWNQKMIGSNPNLIHAGQSLFYYKAGTGMAKKATAAYYANGGKCA